METYKCRYNTLCKVHRDVNLERDAYSIRGTGSTKLYAHAVCEFHNFREMIPLSYNEIRGLKKLIEETYYIDKDGNEIPDDILSIYLILDKFKD